MPRPAIRRVAALGALALIGVVPAAACGSEQLSSLPIQTPVQTPSQTPTATPSRTASAPPSTSTPRTNPPPRPQAPPPGPKPTATSTPTCWGAIRYDLDLENTELALVRSMCFKTGGVLRLQGIGPGLVTATPESLVDYNYEAGVVDIAFVRPGTVTVRIPRDGQTYTITVVVNR